MGISKGQMQSQVIELRTRDSGGGHEKEGIGFIKLLFVHVQRCRILSLLQA